MMTLRRFRRLAESYGADLQRWPHGLRIEALALLEASAQARAIIAAARELDEALAAASTAREARLWAADSPDAALRRLHANVSTRIRQTSSGGISAPGGIDASAAHHLPRRVGWIGFAMAAGLAVLAGLALGVLFSPAAPPQDLTALLQPAPLQLLSD